MTRKDYRLIAGSINESYKDALDFGIDNKTVHETVAHIVNNLAMALELDNKAFDTDKFTEACGVRYDG